MFLAGISESIHSLFNMMFISDFNKTAIQPTHFVSSSDKEDAKGSHSYRNPLVDSSTTESVNLNSLSDILLSMFASRMVYYQPIPTELMRGRLSTENSISDSSMTSEDD